MSLGLGAAPRAARAQATSEADQPLSIRGGTGLLHLSQARSGAPGSFRFSLFGSAFGGSNYLCNPDHPCASPLGGDAVDFDEVQHSTLRLGISATPAEGIEAFGGVRSTSSSSTQNLPKVLDVVGDVTLGARLFTPPTPGQVLALGLEGDVTFLKGSDEAGVDGSATSFGVRGLGSLNAPLGSEAGALSLRSDLNLGYRLDRSSSLVEDRENNAPPDGLGRNISRFERFALGVNRVDLIELGVGTELSGRVLRPFVSWSLDVPINRGDYACPEDEADDNGESCLNQNHKLSTFPSRASVGARVLPWAGLSVILALDIGTGGTRAFVDELTPELPYNLWLGASYSVQTQPAEPAIKHVVVQKLVPVAIPEQVLDGEVVDEDTRDGVKNAVVRVTNLERTAMLTDEEGRFSLRAVKPGPYQLALSAPGYHDGTCRAQIEQLPPRAPGTNRGGTISTFAECPLKALPKLGTVIALTADAQTGDVVGGARLVVTDERGRKVSLQGDNTGTFRFENVPPGMAHVFVEVDGYLPTVRDLTVHPEMESLARILLNKRPRVPRVAVVGQEIRLRTPLSFEGDEAEVSAGSAPIVEELADLLRKKPEIQVVSLVVKVGGAASPEASQALAQARAAHLAAALSALGVDGARIVAEGREDAGIARGKTGMVTKVDLRIGK